MKAIAIDPKLKTVAMTDVSPETRLIKAHFGERPRIVARLPKGDVLLAGTREDTAAFSIGGSGPIEGPALIVGRLTEWGDRRPARVDLNAVITMVRWTTVEKVLLPEPPIRMRAILIDAEKAMIEEVEISAGMHGIERLLGMPVGPHFRLPQEDLVMIPKSIAKVQWSWRKEDLTFPGRCVIVGSDPSNDFFADVSISVENLRSTVQFRRAGDGRWTRYADRQTRAGTGTNKKAQKVEVNKTE
ncbi:hypothetical protein [Bradyrhizobium sp.]|uniref:hypothetical protein n=1 Tax=Bradyrhizobium sp. TaxID=376 RepID=UPI0007C907C1|nr:hypothetical protein [Bradyrhizobium sp.]